MKVEYGEGKIKKMEVARCSRIWEESVSSTRSCCSSTRRIKDKGQKWRKFQAAKVNIQVWWSNFEAGDFGCLEFSSFLSFIFDPPSWTATASRRTYRFLSNTWTSRHLHLFDFSFSIFNFQYLKVYVINYSNFRSHALNFYDSGI